MSLKEKADQFIKEFEKLHPDRKIIFLTVAGSHFFDLASENSDVDFKGIYMPSEKEFYKGESKRKFFEPKTAVGKHTKNSSEDVDFYLFSYTFYLDLLKRGDFNSIELLYTPKDKIIIDSPEYQELVNIRKNLVINDISSFLGFIKKEYKRYGVNINHYKTQKEFLAFLKSYHPHQTLKEIWSDIKKYSEGNDLISFTKSSTGNNNIVPSIKIAQRLYQDTVKVGYVRDGLETILKRYGHRQKNQAASGVEFKGLYHALRLIYEANDIFDHGEPKLPFNKERHKMLKSIKESSIEKESLFKLIDSEIDKLYKREKETVFNKKQVSNTIDNLLFKKIGSYKIKHLMR